MHNFTHRLDISTSTYVTKNIYIFFSIVIHFYVCRLKRTLFTNAYTAASLVRSNFSVASAKRQNLIICKHQHDQFIHSMHMAEHGSAHKYQSDVRNFIMNLPVNMSEFGIVVFYSFFFFFFYRKLFREILLRMQSIFYMWNCKYTYHFMIFFLIR